MLAAECVFGRKLKRNLLKISNVGTVQFKSLEFPLNLETNLVKHNLLNILCIITLFSFGNVAAPVQVEATQTWNVRRNVARIII